MGIFFKKSKSEPKNLPELLVQLEKLKGKMGDVSQELKELKEKNKLSVQKVGIVRFNPFREVGGDQSFSIAILDGNDDGAIITSHYTREGNRVYGKPLKAGKSEYPLSEDELSAIEKAKNHDLEITSESDNKKKNKNPKKSNGK